MEDNTITLITKTLLSNISLHPLGKATIFLSTSELYLVYNQIRMSETLRRTFTDCVRPPLWRAVSGECAHSHCAIHFPQWHYASHMPLEGKIASTINHFLKCLLLKDKLLPSWWDTEKTILLKIYTDTHKLFNNNKKMCWQHKICITLLCVSIFNYIHLKALKLRWIQTIFKPGLKPD